MKATSHTAESPFDLSSCLPPDPNRADENHQSDTRKSRADYGVLIREALGMQWRRAPKKANVDGARNGYHCVCPLLCPPEAKVDVRLMSIKKKPLKIKGFKWWD